MIELAQPPLIVPAKPAIITAAERWESSAQQAMERAGLPRHVRRAVVAELRRLCGVRAKFIGPSVDDLSRYAGMNLAMLPGFPSAVAAAGKKSGGNDQFTVLLLHCDGTDGSTTFVDSSASGHTVTAVGNAQIDTAQSKFGGASLLCDGAGDNLSIADSGDWDFPGDFTVDLWVRFNALTSAALIGNYMNAGTGWMLSFRVDADPDELRFTYGDTTIISRAWTPTTGTWYHVAVVRSGTTMYLFANGVQLGATATNSTNFAGSTEPLAIGRLVSLNLFSLNGWMDEIRVSKGIARWTSNFTPPSRPYF